LGAILPGITLEQAEANLTKWLEAEARVAEGQSFSDSGKSYTSVDADTITKKILFWQNKVDSLSKAGTSTPTFQTIRTRFR